MEGGLPLKQGTTVPGAVDVGNEQHVPELQAGSIILALQKCVVACFHNEVVILMSAAWHMLSWQLGVLY